MPEEQEIENVEGRDAEISTEIEDIAGDAYDELLNSDESEEKSFAGESAAAENKRATEENPSKETATAKEGVEDENTTLIPDETANEAPQHWNQELKDSFGALNKLGGEHTELAAKIKQGMDQTYNGLLKDYQTSKQGVKATEEWQNQIIQRVGQIDPDLANNPQALANSTIEALDALTQLKKDPHGFVQKLAKAVNFDFNKVDDQPYQDPALNQELQKRDNEISQLTQQMQRLTNHIQTNSQTQQNQLLSTKIQEFATATSDSGALKYPHFSDAQVQGYMKIYGDNAFQTGVNITPEDAYNLACRTAGKDTKITQKMETEKVTPNKRITSTTPVAFKQNQSTEQITRDLYDEMVRAS